MPDDGSRVLVIGSGAAGTAAARTLAGAGYHVTVAESGKVGGTCLWHGCMPKKALYNAAHSRRAVIRSEQFGLNPCDPSYDWPAVLAWKWHAQETYAGDQEALFAERGIELVKGPAVFASEDSADVDGTRVEFDHAVLACGSAPALPAIPGIELADTSDDALGYRDPPDSLLIVGGGFIGMEFAGIYASFGTRVTLLVSEERPLEPFDPDTTAVAVRALESLGVAVLTGARLVKLSGSRGAIYAAIDDSAGATTATRFERVLAATGRQPALGGLGLDAACIGTDERGHIVVDAHLRSTNPAVWVAGDAAGGMMQTPIASYEGRTVAESIITGTPVVPDCSAVPICVFTVPQLGQAGLTEGGALAAGIEYRVSTQTHEYLGAAIIEDERDGLVKLLFRVDDDRLLGAHIAGPNAADLAYAMALAICHGATSASLRRISGIHPAYCEALNWAAWS